MKRKFVAALLAVMTLSLGTVGTVFATTENPTAGVESTEEHEGMIWVVDKEAVYDTVVHPEEGHYEDVLVSEEEGHYETVIVEPEEGHYENVLVSEEEGHYETQQVQVGTEPIYETQTHAICRTCDLDLGLATDPEWGGWSEAVMDHIGWHTFNDPGNCVLVKRDIQVQVGENPIYEEKEVWVVDKEAVYEDQWVVDKPAVTEQQWVVDKEAVYEQKWIVDKEAWTEQVLVSPEEGHWEPVNTENPNPEDPDTQEPTTPEDPSQTEEPEVSDSNDANTEASNTNTTNTETSAATENTSSDSTDETGADNNNTDQTTVPQTGDPTNLGYLVSLVGSALTGGSALLWKFRNRK